MYKRILWSLLAMSFTFGCGMTESRRNTKVDTARYVKALKSADTEDRREAAQVLGTLRGGVMTSAPALIKALDDPDPIVSSTAATSLRQLLSSEETSRDRDQWTTIWRREKKRILKEKKLDPKDASKRASARVKNDLGVAELNKGDYLRAERFFRESLLANPDDPITHSNLSKSLMPQKRLTEAIDSLRRALSLDPQFHQAHYNIAQAFIAMTQVMKMSREFADSQYINALQHIDAAIKLVPKGEVPWAYTYLKAKIFFSIATGEQETAERIEFYMKADSVIAEARKIAPKSVDVRIQGALISYALEKYYRAYKDAVVVYKLGYEMDTDFIQRLSKKLRRQYYDQNMVPPPFPWEAEEQKKDRAPALSTPGME